MHFTRRTIIYYGTFIIHYKYKVPDWFSVLHWFLVYSKCTIVSFTTTPNDIYCSSSPKRTIICFKRRVSRYTRDGHFCINSLYVLLNIHKQSGKYQLLLFFLFLTQFCVFYSLCFLHSYCIVVSTKWPGIDSVRIPYLLWSHINTKGLSQIPQIGFDQKSQNDKKSKYCDNISWISFNDITTIMSLFPIPIISIPSGLHLFLKFFLLFNTLLRRIKSHSTIPILSSTFSLITLLFKIRSAF